MGDLSPETFRRVLSWSQSLGDTSEQIDADTQKGRPPHPRNKPNQRKADKMTKDERRARDPLPLEYVTSSRFYGAIRHESLTHRDFRVLCALIIGARFQEKGEGQFFCLSQYEILQLSKVPPRSATRSLRHLQDVGIIERKRVGPHGIETMICDPALWSVPRRQTA